MDYFEVIILSFYFLIFLNPLVTKSFIFLILLYQIKEIVISFFPFSLLDEGISFGDSFHKGKQGFLVSLVHCEDFLNIAIFAWFQCQVQDKDKGFNEIIAI